MEKLRVKQEKLEKQKRKNTIEMENLIKQRFSWIRKTNTVSNIPIHNRNNGLVMQSNDSQQSSLVFVHQSRSAGSHVISCMNDISYERKISMSPVMDFRSRLLWESSNDENRKHKDVFQFHRGRHSFGMCEKLKSRCSYFTIFRDPFDSILSLFEYCKKNADPEVCVTGSASNVTLREWIMDNSGMLLYKFATSHDQCSNPGLNHNARDNTDKDPCWIRQKNYLDNTLSNSERSHIANYVTNNLQNWFAAIGLFSEINTSMEIFQQVFNQPFSRCKSRDLSSNDEYVVTNSAHSLKDDDDGNDDRGSNDNDDFQDENYYEEDADVIDEVETLRNDLDIREILKHDYIIYNEARRLFHMQKQVLYNKLGNT